MNRVWAAADLHVSYAENRKLLTSLPTFPHDWLLVAGDVGETFDDVRFAWDVLCSKFSKVIWTPGNHELWTLPREKPAYIGVERYRCLVDLCRQFGVLTPEDPFLQWKSGQDIFTIAPVFVLYDYSFRPALVAVEDAVTWAMAEGVLCSDEKLLSPQPYASFPEWCEERVRVTESRLNDITSHASIVLLNHFPLRQDIIPTLAWPRFSIWCGTKKTEHWTDTYPVQIVVYGHLHIPGTQWKDGVRFEEVSLGYPGQRHEMKRAEQMLRQILPTPEKTSENKSG